MRPFARPRRDPWFAPRLSATDGSPRRAPVRWGLLAALALVVLGACADDAGSDTPREQPDAGVEEDANNAQDVQEDDEDVVEMPSGPPLRGCLADDECGADARCVPVPMVEGAAHYCVPNPPLTPNPCQGDGRDGCCEDADCQGGAEGRFGVCHDAMVGFCGGAPPPSLNACSNPECNVDEACPEGRICLPAGLFGRPVNTCVEAACGSDADCTLLPGGQCQMVFNGQTCPAPLLSCTYGDSPCRVFDACPPGQLCIANSARDDTVCLEERPAP